jgi:hypothetical protein
MEIGMGKMERKTEMKEQKAVHRKDETPFERFKWLTKRVVSVPHAEIQKRETAWKNGRKQHKSHHRHR